MKRTETVMLPTSFEKALAVLDVERMQDFIPYIKETQAYSDGGKKMYRQTISFEGNAFTYDIEEVQKNVGDGAAAGSYIIYIDDKIKLRVTLDFDLVARDANNTELAISYDIEAVNNNFINRGIVSVINSKLSKEYMPLIKEQVAKFAATL